VQASASSQEDSKSGTLPQPNNSPRQEKLTLEEPSRQETWQEKFLMGLSKEIYWKRVVPVCGLFSISLLLSNKAYLFLTVCE
jgi:hypothetical protein